MLLLVSPLTRSDSGVNLGRNCRPIFHFSLERFLDGQIRSMNWQGRRGMMTGGLQLVPAKPITMRLRKVQIALIKIEVVLFVRGKSASNAFKSIEFSLIQFDTFAPDSSHIIRLTSLSYSLRERDDGEQNVHQFLDQLGVILIEFPLFDAFDESLDLGRVGGWNVIVEFHRRSIAPILCQTSAFTKPEANFFSFFTTLS